jgi:bacillithiol biosynthesis deacetylase BshB1
MSEVVDILCITAHPDDVEISASGTVARHIAMGRKVGYVELTAGELGTRGDATIRRREAEAARHAIGAAFRYDLGLADGTFQADPASLHKVVASIRRHRPAVVITNAVRDRHPDHGRAARLVAQACFLSGLRRLVTEHEGLSQEQWRPTLVLNMIQDRWIEPHLVVDITAHWPKKIEVLACFRSQFHDPSSTEPLSPLSTPDFMPALEGRGRQLGRIIGVSFGEGFTVDRAVGVGDLTTLG